MLPRKYVLAFGIGLCVMVFAGEAFAQSFTTLDVLNIFKRVAALEAAVLRLEKTNAVQTLTIKTLAANLNAAEATIAALQTDLGAVKGSGVMALNPFLTVTTDTRGPLVRFSGLNLQLVNGAGTTNTVNGLGNLMVGYDAECLTDGCTANVKTGSHYVIVGDRHNYSAYGGIVVGAQNSSLAPWVSVTGGTWNTASGTYSSVMGGEVNAASATSSSIIGGSYNRAAGGGASVCGGILNEAYGGGATVTGGRENTAIGGMSSVSGGWAHTVGGQYNWAAGSLREDQ
jgi:hypothetical protein